MDGGLGVEKGYKLDKVMSMSVIAGSETDDEMDTEIPRPFFNKVFEFPLPSPLWTLWTVWESEKSFLDDVGRNPFWRKDDLTQKLVETVNNAGGRQIVKLNFCSIYVVRKHPGLFHMQIFFDWI